MAEDNAAPASAASTAAANAKGGRLDAAASASAYTSLITSGGPPISLVRKEDEARVSWTDILRKRIAQHNVRVASKWYARMQVARLGQLLGLDGPTTEAVVAELAAEHAVYAKIDRPAGIVSFSKPKPAAEVLSEMTYDVGKVMGLLEKCRHEIEREVMVSNAAAAAAGRP